MTEAEVWRSRYEMLKSAVVGVCAAAEVGTKKMGGKECIDLITTAVKVIEDRGLGVQHCTPESERIVT